VSERVFILGAGLVGRGLFRAFRGAGVEVVGLHSRRPSPAATSSGSLPAVVADANVVVVAVRDHQIDDAIEQLIEIRRGGQSRVVSPGTVIVHTSGGAEPKLIPKLASMGLWGGTFHPLIPFANPEKAPELLRQAWVGIDGDESAKAMSRRLAGHVGARTLDIPSGAKSVYHAAAVIGSNFPVILAAVATRLLSETGVPPASAARAVEGLMLGAVSNLLDADPESVLTGPVIRGDAATVQRHLQALRQDPEARALYRRLSFAALEIASRRGTDPARLAEIQNVLLLR
jgi:predicted short-subunit dehydrogenase-like oxidoreductase (DUF2520 family)